MCGTQYKVSISVNLDNPETKKFGGKKNEKNVNW
jgi:hypothetical protein